MTFDRDLLSWLGDEPEAIRRADAERVRDIAAEFAAGFDRLAGQGGIDDLEPGGLVVIKRIHRRPFSAFAWCGRAGFRRPTR